MAVQKRSAQSALCDTHLTFDSFDEALELHFDTASIERHSAKGRALLWRPHWDALQRALKGKRASHSISWSTHGLRARWES